MQPREKQTEIDQLQYELTTQSRRYDGEVSALRQRIAELELNLAETRREADEYFKGGLQTNLEATALGNQVSIDSVFKLRGSITQSLTLVQGILVLFPV